MERSMQPPSPCHYDDPREEESRTIKWTRFFASLRMTLLNGSLRKYRMRDGQGLLETIIAIGIITSGLFAILTLVAANARVGEATALRFGAIQTAREWIEVVRAMRDSNWLAGSAWNTGLEGSGVDYSAIAVFDAATSTWSLVYGANALSENAARVIRRESNGETFFTQDASGGEGAGRTPYRRLIFVDPICESSDGARVTVTR